PMAAPMSRTSESRNAACNAPNTAAAAYGANVGSPRALRNHTVEPMRNMAATQVAARSWSTRRRPPRPRKEATASRARQARRFGKITAFRDSGDRIESAEVERLDRLFEE